MRSNFPNQHEINSVILHFDRCKERLEAAFKEAKTIKQKNSLLLDNYQYAYFYTNPSSSSMKKIGFRFRECYRKMGGHVPPHIQDCIIKADSRYSPRFTKLTAAQQEFVASTNPWIVYGWRNLFDTAILKTVNPNYDQILQSMELLGVQKEQFNESFLTIHHNKDSLAAASLDTMHDIEL